MKLKSKVIAITVDSVSWMDHGKTRTTIKDNVGIVHWHDL